MHDPKELWARGLKVSSGGAVWTIERAMPAQTYDGSVRYVFEARSGALERRLAQDDVEPLGWPETPEAWYSHGKAVLPADLDYNDYTRVLVGLSIAVLKTTGARIDPCELSRRFHSPLAGIALDQTLCTVIEAVVLEHDRVPQISPLDTEVPWPIRHAADEPDRDVAIVLRRAEEQLAARCKEKRMRKGKRRDAYLTEIRDHVWSKLAEWIDDLKPTWCETAQRHVGTARERIAVLRERLDGLDRGDALLQTLASVTGMSRGADAAAQRQEAKAVLTAAIGRIERAVADLDRPAQREGVGLLGEALRDARSESYPLLTQCLGTTETRAVS